MTKKSKNVALVLSSGGARGMAHIGVIEGLIDAGFNITAIAGSSMGAVVGGMYAAGKLNEYKEWLLQLDKLEVFRLVDFTFSTQGFIRGEKVFTEMKKFIDDKKIEELNIPFSAVACDILNRKEVVFDKGSLYTALRASASIPSIIKPSIYKNAELVDGGVTNPIPINHVKNGPNDLIVVSDVNAAISYSRPMPFEEETDNKYQGMLGQFVQKWEELVPKREKAIKPNKKLSYFELFNKSINLMQDQISAQIIEKYQPDVLVNVSRDACSTFDFHKAEELIVAGKTAFKKSISKT